MSRFSNLRRRASILALVATTTLLGACSRVETGEVGLRRAYDGVIKEEALLPGLYQSLVGSVLIFANKEILLPIEKITAQTHDKTTLRELDINFTYVVKANAISELFTHYSSSAHLQSTDGHEIFPMGNFIAPLVRSAAYSAVAEYDALTVNDNREKIAATIKELANKKLAEENLSGKIEVKLVSLRNIQLADEIVSSANRVVQAQNDLLTKKKEVEIAVQEALRIAELSKQTDDKYTRLLEAQSKKVTADALMAAAQKGSTIWVVPASFTSLGNTAGR